MAGTDAVPKKRIQSPGQECLATQAQQKRVCTFFLMYPSNNFVKALRPLTHFRLTSEVLHRNFKQRVVNIDILK